MKGLVVMGVFLTQLPPSEVARLKAELAETLIANFCYPRFFDYRTGTLRMRPIDRAKRQEVWLYLSSVDFTAWNRVDLMSSDFQHQIERLFIQFVQRNRTFFGEQGRKRMTDIRMLIGASALAVTEGLRGHLTGQQQHKPPFGSPRSVLSWSVVNGNSRPEPAWEEMAPATLLLQQQLQELRGEIKSEARPPATNTRRANRGQPTGSAANGAEPEVPPVQRKPTKRTSSSVAARGTAPLPDVKSAAPLNPQWTTAPTSTPMVSPVQKAEPMVTPIEMPTSVPSVPMPAVSRVYKAEQPTAPIEMPALPISARSVSIPQSVQQRGLPQASLGRESTLALVSEEDRAIFEQMRLQLVVWLRVEAVRAGIDISDQGPAQLLERLHEQDNFDETRLQIVSTLLNLSNQVIKNGQASLIDYKQALMFHLMHTRR